MSSTKVYDAVATVGEYTGKDGNKKRRYLNVGAVFKNENGMYLKLDALPLGKDWTGFISFYEPKQKGQEQPATAATQAPADAEFDDKIPF